MSERFEIGGQCVCIEGGLWHSVQDHNQTKMMYEGTVYTIEDIYRPSELFGIPLLLKLIGLENWQSAKGFRPCKKTDISELEKLLKEKPNQDLVQETVADVVLWHWIGS